MPQLETNFQKDIDDIAQIAIVPTLLDIVCQTTGMRFSAIARVTEDRWITCGVHDDILFGLKPGDELKIETTLCHEVRQKNGVIVIDHVDEDEQYCAHHTPAMYGFQSYISVPITRRDGTLFGTLCAIDPKPNKLNTPAIIGMFNLYAELISFHLNAQDELHKGKLQMTQDRLMYTKSLETQKIFSDALEMKVQERTQELLDKNRSLEKMNAELDSFNFISSHDLQEPLRKIQTFSSIILSDDKQKLSDSSKKNFEKIQLAAQRMRTLIKDLLSYSRTKTDLTPFENTDLEKLITDVKNDMHEELKSKNATIEIGSLCTVNIIPFQFRQLFFNLFNNSLKFSKPDEPVHIKITSTIAEGKTLDNSELVPDKKYCHLTILDNGIGFEEQYKDHIFKLFHRLHNVTDYEGTGMGLTIVKKIIDNHNGMIIATGKPNVGARFDIYMPVEN